MVKEWGIEPQLTDSQSVTLPLRHTLLMIPKTGLEPARLSTGDSKSPKSTSSITSAYMAERTGFEPANP